MLWFYNKLSLYILFSVCNIEKMELKRKDATLYYEIEGAQDGPMMVFSNSLGTTLSVWDQLLPLLPQGWRFLRYDMRGHGRSLMDGPFGMQDLVHDATALIEATGGKDVIFVGLSIGGMIGQGLAAERPDLVKGFVLMDSAAKIGTEESWDKRIQTVRENGLGAISDQVMSLWFTKSFRAQNLDAPWKAMLESTPIEGYLGACEAIKHTDLWVSTANLTLPTLALVGSEDGSTPPDLVRETAALIANSEFKIIRKAGHIPCVEQPEETAKLIAEFARRIL